MTDSTDNQTNNVPAASTTADTIAALEAEPITLAKFWKGPRNRRDQVVIRLSAYRGAAFVDVRLFYCDDKGKSRPGPKGVALVTSLLPQLTCALLKAEDKARELGLIPDAAEGE
ncbi:transcriptional coactivator p15/PC4 family protein [Bradyrhizobium sp. HKCCYLS2033]|uniref:transcriptional coactivator p15/PC4 family protein n=1 Tax=Bradyrhizobium sp. HKCCYLS2033 TaxID=3420739 RepID=UPI003EBE36BB